MLCRWKGEWVGSWRCGAGTASVMQPGRKHCPGSVSASRYTNEAVLVKRSSCSQQGSCCWP